MTAFSTWFPTSKYGTLPVNIRAFGALGDGSDSTEAFEDFKAWAVTQTAPIELLVPPGEYVYDNPGVRVFQGIKRLVVRGYGATFSAEFGTQFCGGTIQLGSNFSEPIATVAADSLTVTCATPANAAKFPAGSWVLIGALNIQRGGFPPNLHFFEFAKVAARDTGTGVVTLTRWLKNSYKSTYPRYDATGPSDYDDGGPATMYALHSSWDTEVEFIGIHFAITSTMYNQGRSIIYTDCTFAGNGPVPTVSKLFVLRRSQGDGLSPDGVNALTIEVDKLVEQVRFENYALSRIDFQSSSIEKAVIDGCSINNSLTGTPKNIEVRNSDIRSWMLGVASAGAYGYGMTESILAVNSKIREIETPTLEELPSAISSYTLAKGTLSVADTNQVPSQRWAVPGLRGFLCYQRNAGNNHGVPFIITDVRKDGSNIKIDTIGLPDVLPTFTGGNVPLYYGITPCPRITFINCSGCDLALTLSNAPPDMPLFTYYNRTLSGNFGTSTGGMVNGMLVSLKINVLRASTRAGALALHVAGPFGAGTRDVTYTHVEYDPVVDLKTAGLRIITPAAVVGSVGADSMGAAPGANWFTGNFSPSLSIAGVPVDLSGDDPDTWPIVNIEIITDQGIIQQDNFFNGATLVAG